MDNPHGERLPIVDSALLGDLALLNMVMIEATSRPGPFTQDEIDRLLERGTSVRAGELEDAT